MTDKEQEQKVTYTRPKDEGEVDKRRFAAIMGAAGTATVIALITFFSVGMVGAAMGVGIGGFVANFEEVSYNDGNASIYPVLGSQAACENAPQIEASLGGDATLIGGVEFFKDLPLPSSSTFGNDRFARVSIVGNGSNGGITVTDLDLRITALETPTLNLTDADIKEFDPTEYNTTADDAAASYAPSGEGVVNSSATGFSNATRVPEFGIEANSFNLPKGGTAATHQVSLGSIDLDDLNLFVQILNESENTGTSNGSVARVVNPSDRTCQALAQASTAGDVVDNDTATGGPQLRSTN